MATLPNDASELGLLKALLEKTDSSPRCADMFKFTPGFADAVDSARELVTAIITLLQ
jgi:hypothetical protein